MELFKKIKEKGYVKRLKPSTRKKIIERQVANRLVAGVLLFLLLSSLVAVIKTFSQTGVVEQLSQQVNAVESQVTGLDEQKTEQIDLFVVRYVFGDFLEAYINSPVDSEQQKVREEVLKKYFVKHSDYAVDKNDVERQLISYELIGVSEAEGFYRALFDVRYQLMIAYETAPQVVEMKPKEVRAVFAVPFVFGEGKYAVSGYPYVAPTDDLIDVGLKRVETVSEPETDLTVKKEVEDFLKNFLDKYASGKQEDLAYFMQEPKGLNGQYVYLEHDLIRILKTEVADQYDVLVKVSFSDKEAVFKHSERIRLRVVKQGGKYVVLSLSQE